MARDCFKNFRLYLIAAVAALCIGCSPETPNKNGTNGAGPAASAQPVNKAPAADVSPAPQAPESWVNIPGLANKTPEELESVAGKHVTITPVTEPPQEVPGEYRTYNLSDMKEALSVRFYKGKAVAFTISLPKGRELKTAAELGKAVGFDLTGKAPAKATDFMSQWNGQFGSARFAEVTIGKSATTDYNLVRARIQQ
jgi:hypothetical protein